MNINSELHSNISIYDLFNSVACLSKIWRVDVLALTLTHSFSIPGTVAAQSGIKEEDYIMSINGLCVSNGTTQTVANVIRWVFF